ncbi:MAG: Cof-type HAD-IIB family hydrolase [Bacteroidota bacterium]
MPIRLILLDLDDTLLGKDLQISAANREALARAGQRGVQVTLATGRMFRSMRPYAEILGLELPLIAYNGALARPLAGTDLWHEPLAHATAQALLARLADHDVTVNLYLDDRLYVKELDRRAQAYAANAGVPAEPIGDLAAFLGDRAPTKMLAMGAPDLLAGLRASLGAEFAGRAEIVTSKPHYLEIMAPNISKAMALERLAAKLGLELSETMAIGDGPNDLGMLLQAGVGVAVGNAPPEVRARVPRVVAPSDRDGVAEAVYKYILSEE